MEVKPMERLGSTVFVDVKPAFEKEAGAMVAAVCTSLAAFVTEVSPDLRRPRELQRMLGVDYKICWQVFNVIQAEDRLVAAKHVPSPQALRRFLQAGRKAGVPQSTVDAVQTSVEEFSTFVNAHADDRDTFQSMVAAASSDEGDATKELQQRRAAYRALSQIWGAQVDGHFSAILIKGSSTGPGTDECVVSMKRGFRKLRSDASPIVYGASGGSATSHSDKLPTALDPKAVMAFQAPLLPEFSSQPLPPLKTVAGASGWAYTTLASEGIGRKNSVDLAFGVHWKNIILEDPDGDRIVRTGVTFRTPTALLIHDMLIHRDSFGLVNPEARAYQSTPDDATPTAGLYAPQLRLTDRVANLGPADQIGSTLEWPSYRQMITMAAARMNWNLAEFDVYRLRVPFPVFGSITSVQFKYRRD